MQSSLLATACSTANTTLPSPEPLSCLQEYEDELQRPTRPGIIDNGLLFADHGKLKDRLQEGEDYVFRTPETWRLLCKLYPGSGPEISSVILADGRPELYCFRYLVHRSSDLGGQPKEVQLSKEVSLPNCIPP